MMFQHKIDRIFKKLHEDSDHPEEEDSDRKKGPARPQQESDLPELEKNDFLAMVLAALITIVPIALIVIVGIVFIGYFLFFR